jgi:putative Mg2+ transporter-C (MgtC) family protein
MHPYPFPASETEIVLRLLMAMLLGLLVGAERTRVGKRAGMRTYALVSLGSALFIIVAGSVSALYQNLFNFDPLRVASQVVVGIGFLGAGVIFVQKESITGLTTAAGLWVVAGVGIAAGFGLFFVAVSVAALMLFVFEILWYVEDRFIRRTSKDSAER